MVEPSSVVVKWPTQKELTAAFELYAVAVGRVAHAWNYLQEKFALLFVEVTGADRTLALAVWYSVSNDRTQRGMLKAAINAGPERKWESAHLSGVRSGLLWLLSEAETLGDARNDAIHAPCSAITSVK